MKKIFGGIKMTWLKVIISAIVIGVAVGLLNCVPALRGTSIQDPAIHFSFWILCGVLIIMNSESNLDSALKCFFFFLISQPIIYLVEVPFVQEGWKILGYYKNWIVWTILCFPMGFIGYYMKKNKWWGLIILLPMMGFLATEASGYLGEAIYAFPHHILSYLFAVCLLIIFPLFIFDNKKIRITGTIIGVLAAIITSILPFLDKQVYETDMLCSGEERVYDDSYKVSIGDSKIGEVSIKKMSIEGDDEEFYCIHSIFYKTGETTISLESPEGETQKYNIIVKENTYDITEVTDKEEKTQTESKEKSNKQISKEEAKNIALSNAKLKESQVKGLTIEKDTEKGIKVYEVDFKYNGMEYEYNIDITSGNIVKKSVEKDD